MTTTETQATDTATVCMDTPYHVPARNAVRGTVIDCAAYALRNADDTARSYQQLNTDFVHDYRAQLDQAALAIDATGTSLFSRVLTDVWAEHGYTADLRDETDSEAFAYEQPRQPADAVYYAVWDEAVYRLDPNAVVRAARLDDVLATTYAD